MTAPEENEQRFSADTTGELEEDNRSVNGERSLEAQESLYEFAPSPMASPDGPMVIQIAGGNRQQLQDPGVEALEINELMEEAFSTTVTWEYIENCYHPKKSL